MYNRHRDSHSRVRFDTHSNEPEIVLSPSEEDYHHFEEIRERSRPRSHNQGPLSPSVRFSLPPHSHEGAISSPVLRNPTPYVANLPVESEDDEHEEDILDAYYSPRDYGESENQNYQFPRSNFQTMSSPNVQIPSQTREIGYPAKRTHEEYPASIHQAVSPRIQQHAITTPKLPPQEHCSSVSESSSDGTLYDENGAEIEKDKGFWDDSLQEPPKAHIRDESFFNTPTSPQPLRPALRRPVSEVPTNLEEGGVRARRGVFSNLLSHYGLSRKAPDPEDLLVSRNNTEDDIYTTSIRPGYRRRDSAISAADHAERRPMDPDHPHITGIKKNRRDKEEWEKETPTEGNSCRRSSAGRSLITYHKATMQQRQIFILRLAKALMTFGAPSHRIESQLEATATVLEVDAEFVHLPSVIIASFGDQDTKTSDTHFIKANGRLALVHDEISAEEGTIMLSRLMKERPIYGLKTRCLIAFACCALICPLAFGGSLLDMGVAGVGGAVLCFLQLHAASKNSMYANVFEISVAILMSFVARALSSIPSQLFCYEAISSAGVVLILPGYLILCSALELASKNIVNGSVRMIYAIIYSLFLGFGLTIGSDLYFIIDPRARRLRREQTTNFESTMVLHGTFTSDNSTSLPSFEGAFTFSNGTRDADANTVLGCFRDPSWPWYKQDFPVWSLFILVPTFSLFSSSWNLQPFRSKQLPVMVIISCAAFAANKAANYYIFNRSDVVSAIGAFVVGILGNAYSRIFRGTAFQCMVVGVLFLVPSGIAAAGGLAENYRGQDGDEYSTGLAIGLRMVQVAIGITVGLFGSGLIVYSFGSRKNAALFAF